MKRLHLIRPISMSLTLFLFIIFVCGCANLSKIREFSDISLKITDGYTALVDYYLESPSRQKRFQPVSQHERLDRISKQRLMQKESLLLRHSLIESYISALGGLAVEEVVVYDKELDKTGRVAKEGSLLNKKESMALSAIGSLLFRAATDKWRKDELKKLINDSNESFQTIILSLKRIIEQGFIGDLENEKIAINKYYRSIIVRSNDKAGIAALEEWKEYRLNAINARKDMVVKYSNSLSRISEGHQKLYDNKENISSKEFLENIGRYTEELRDVYNTINNF